MKYERKMERELSQGESGEDQHGRMEDKQVTPGLSEKINHKRSPLFHIYLVL